MTNREKQIVAMKEEGKTNQAIADAFDTSEASIRRALHKVGFKPYLIPSYARKKLDARLEKPITLDVSKTGPLAVTADWHHPLADYDLINSFLDHANEVGARELVVAGDWFNVDALSAFDFKDSDNAGLTKELYASNVTINRVLEVFDRVHLSWGNHDARVHKALGYQVPFATAMRMMFTGISDDKMARINLSNLDHLHIKTPNGLYAVVHPKAYSTQPLMTARKLAAKELCHIITGHSHHTAIGHDVSGEFVCAEIGGFFDAAKTAYIQRTTTFPKWQNGYGFIDSDGMLALEGKGWSTHVGRKIA